MSIFSRRLLTTTHNVTIGNYLYWDQEGELELNAPYQREYVWGEQEQQDFLYSIFNNLPLGTLAIIDRDCYVEGVPNYEVVDGKQRLTTLLMFLKNELTYSFEGKDYFFKDLDKVIQRQVTGKGFPFQQLYWDVTEKDKLEYFYRVNFTGVPQSKEHMEKILNLMLVSEGKEV